MLDAIALILQIRNVVCGVSFSVFEYDWVLVFIGYMKVRELY